MVVPPMHHKMNKFLSAILLTVAIATVQQVQAANYSAGAKIGSPGSSASFSLKNNLQFRSDDQLQTRFEISVSTADTVEGRTFAGTEYNKSDTGNNWSARTTVDWFPFTDGNRFFVSAGLDFNESRFTADANRSMSYSIGNQAVNPGENISTNLDIDYNNPISPFLGIGWGNRIGRNSGLSFLAEIGVLILSGDVDVKLEVTDPDNRISDADINMEKKQIEKQIDSFGGLVSIGVLYHF